MSTRCEILLSPGGRTTPPTRGVLAAAKPAPPGGRAGEPRRQRSGISHLERALDRAERFLERPERRQDLVAVHQQDFSPQRRVARREARGVSRATAEGDRKSTRLNSSHRCTSYAVFCLKKKSR